MPDFAFDFADDDLDRHAALIDRLTSLLPLDDATLDSYSKELVIVAPDAAAAMRRAIAIVERAAQGPDLYLAPEGRGWIGGDPADQAA